MHLNAFNFLEIITEHVSLQLTIYILFPLFGLCNVICVAPFGCVVASEGPFKCYVTQWGVGVSAFPEKS